MGQSGELFLAGTGLTYKEEILKASLNGFHHALKEKFKALASYDEGFLLAAVHAESPFLVGPPPALVGIQVVQCAECQ